MDAVTPLPPKAPQVRLSLGVTGHRAGHPGFAVHADRIAQTITALLDSIEAAAKSAPCAQALGPFAPTRLHSLLADGTDRMASLMGLERGYELVAPLPFGQRLNRAINSLTADPADARRLLAGEAAHDPETQAHAAAIDELADRSRVFELADGDVRLGELFLARLEAPHDGAKAALFAAECSRRVAMAGQILIEQSDLLIAVWDGVSSASVGGTGHTIATALQLGVPVVWINPARPEGWQLLFAPEALTSLERAGDPAGREAALAGLVHAALDCESDEGQPGFSALDHEHWRPRSNRLAHAYRRIEALFGGSGFRRRWRSLVVHYESPDAIVSGSSSGFLREASALPGADRRQIDTVAHDVIRRFAWADGISARLSDAYRGGMTVSFVLSSLAIVAGISYLPLTSADNKWIFAGIELLLLCGVLLITTIGQRRKFHTRWFETRRVAEYLRHAPLLLIMGAARPAGRWPHGAEAGWPEFYARQVLREVGLPRMVVSQAYLRGVLTGPLGEHVRGQRDYHFGKAQRLGDVHRRLDGLSESLFQMAVAAVSTYLALHGIAEGGFIAEEPVAKLSKVFTVLGVMFPTFGAGIAGLRYFGDFERFGEISQVTAEKLDAIARRIELLEQAGEGRLEYGDVAELIHATDDVVVAEIESWQAVFGGKHIAVPA